MRPRLLAFGPMIAVAPVERLLCIALTVFKLVLLARVIVSWIALAAGSSAGHRTAPFCL